MSEAQKIVSAYLTRLGWVREMRRNMAREIRNAWSRDEMEAKARRLDALEEEAEGEFSSQIESLKQKDDRETLRSIFDLIRHRSDLGFFGKRILEHLRNIV